MTDQEEQQIIKELSDQKPPRQRRWFFGAWISLLIAALVVVGFSLIYKTGFTFSQIQVEKQPAGLLPISEGTPGPDSDRLNILLLGLRGESDPNGGLLTDSIMILSLKKSTNQVAIISIPRDLYVAMPGEDYKEKINFAYALGYEKRGDAGALLYSKTAVSKATGLYIDHAVSVDHIAFKEVIDALGGIDIYLEKPFIENQQWVAGGDIGSPSGFFYIESENATSSAGAVKKQRWVFKIPAGASHLDGDAALYYVRARYSSSDFDRVRRQQQVLLAMKEKALSLNFLTNPVKIYNVLDSLGKNIRTDASMSEIRNLIALIPQISDQNIIHKVFDTTPEGLLYSSKSSAGAYILLPVSDNFEKIQETCKNIFN